MSAIARRTQWKLVAFGYAATFVIGAALIFGRYLMEVRNAAEVNAAGGMYGIGDMVLYVFVVCLFVIPTLFLIWVLSRDEAPYTTYSKVLLGLSLTEPVCLAVFMARQRLAADGLLLACLCRLFFSPLMLVGIGVSLFLARFRRARRFIFCALLVEGLTLAISARLFFHWLSIKNQ